MTPKGLPFLNKLRSKRRSNAGNDKGPAEPESKSGDDHLVDSPLDSRAEERSEPYGLFLLNEQYFEDITKAGKAQYSADIIALHGINGDAYNTWTHQNTKFWLRDFLPQQLPGARVFTFGYPSEVAFSLATSRLQDFARSLLEELNYAVITALIDAGDYANIRDSVKGILFLGTPHRGSSTAWLPQVLANITNLFLTSTSRFTGQMRSDLLKSLEKDSDMLKTVSMNFRNQASNIKIISFIEQKTTPPLKQRVVDEVSGVMDIPKETIVPMDGCDHRDICRFEDPTSPGYRKVLFHLEKLAGVLHSKLPAFTAEEQECLKSLSFEGIGTRRNNIDAALENTCTWLFEHPNYCDWEKGEGRNEHNGLLWIKGKPGSGKSTLMKQALQHAEQNASHHRTANHSVTTVAFFFNARGSALERTPLGLFRSLLHQLFQQIRPLLSEFLPMFRQKQSTLGSWSWHLEELRKYFHTATTRTQDHPIVVFVDALDECDEKSVQKIVEFFERTASSAVSAGCDLRICLSSRHYPNIRARSCLEIRMEDFNKSDISIYVRTKLRTMAQASNNFVETIITKASGVFLWVVLVVTRLSEAISDGEPTGRLLNILNSVPTGLNELFVQTVNTIPKAERQEAAQMMLWVLLAERPLTLTELRFALAFGFPHKSQKECEASSEFVTDDEQMERLLRRRTRGLIEATKTGKDTASTTQFIHESVRDFLLRENGLYIIDPSLGEGTIGKGHDQIKKSCINYIKIEELFVTPSEDNRHETSNSSQQRLETLTRNYPFLQYSVTSLFKHAAKAENEGVSQVHLSQDFQWPQGGTLESWGYHYDLVEADGCKQGPQTPLLRVASQYGLFTCVEPLLKQGVDDANAQGRGFFGNPLQAASYGGHDRIVELLLAKGADVNAQGGDSGNALQAASVRGHNQTVELLLRNGADVNALGGSDGTALQAASPNGHDHIVELLLEKGADVNAQGGGVYGTALLAASLEGHDHIVELLLEKGADVNAQGGATFGTALQAASLNGRDHIVEMLLEKGADVNPQGGATFGTALQAASFSGRDHIVEMLLEKGADVNPQREGIYGTALQAASYGGHDHIVELLLEKGADVNPQGEGIYGTALQAASYGGHDHIVELLLEKGADVNAQGGATFGTALQAASASPSGRDHIVKLLLEKGADVNALGGSHGTALQAASLSGYDHIVELLLEKGAGVNTQGGGTYGTALQAASFRGHDHIVELLLEKGADINAQGGRRYGTALQAASSSGQDHIVELLLEKGANVNAQGRGEDADGTALQEVSLGGRDYTVELLLENGADANAQGGGLYGTALQEASLSGHGHIVELLLEKGADVNARGGGVYGTALQAASLRGHDHIVELLLEKGADVNAQGGRVYGTALQAASSRGHDRIVQLLKSAIQSQQSAAGPPFDIGTSV